MIRFTNEQKARISKIYTFIKKDFKQSKRKFFQELRKDFIKLYNNGVYEKIVIKEAFEIYLLDLEDGWIEKEDNVST